jgi:hypothetical protein
MAQNLITSKILWAVDLPLKTQTTLVAVVAAVLAVAVHTNLRYLFSPLHAGFYFNHKNS